MRISRSHLPTATLALAGMPLALAQTETRLPIISRVEVKYSIVSHYSHLSDRVDFYNRSGQPQGNANYVVPHLVYEPIVTLYNPYNTTLTLPKVRVQIANPPVGFKFKKNNDYLREEWTNGGPFLGLGRFQQENESNPNAQKTITLLLRTGSWSSSPSRPITLLPGQVMSFAAWVEPNWSWGLETFGPTDGSRVFFDFSATNDRTNKDGRTNNLFGVEAIQGQGPSSYPLAHDYRAGFQTDGLSVSTGRPAATRYPFETGKWGTSSWVAIKLNESFSVEAKGVDTVLDPLVPDFQISLMGGVSQNTTFDTLKKYSFTIDDLAQPETVTPQAPAISRTFVMRDILQKPSDDYYGGKTPIASFQLIARSTALQKRKFQAKIQPPSNELYEARFEERMDYNPSGPFDGPSDYLRSGIVVTGFERIADSLMMDIAAEPFHGRIPYVKIMGGGDLAAPLTDDLTSRAWIRPGPEGTGIYKLTVPVPPGSGTYFVQIGY